MSKLIMALVLVDVAAHQLKAGTLVEADKGLIDALVKTGEVDPHKEAVAYAKSQGVSVVRSAIELAAEQREAQRQALLVEVAQLEHALAAATEDEVKAAVTTQIASKRAEAAELA